MLKSGFDSLEEHELLELLLFYIYKRADTNKRAHKMIQSYGSLQNVFRADIKEMISIKKFGVRMAVLIALIPYIARKYINAEDNRKELSSIQDAAEYVKPLLIGNTKEEFYVISLDAKNKIITKNNYKDRTKHIFKEIEEKERAERAKKAGKISSKVDANKLKNTEVTEERTSKRIITADKVSSGTTSETIISVRKIVEIALINQATAIILAHNHPGGNAKPSKNDIVTTENIKKALKPLGIVVQDHIIICDEMYYSFCSGANYKYKKDQ